MARTMTGNDAPASPQYEIDGINHLALMCGDMKRTTDFYEGVLGMPLVKTLQMPNGGQHFFFDISEGNGIAFFWFPGYDKQPAPGIANAGWDPVTGLRSPVSAVGTMHHLSFDVPREKLDEYASRLSEAGVEVTKRIGVGALEDGEEACIETVYFPDPDGFVLGFSSWTRALTPEDVRHEPAGAVVVKAEQAAKEEAAVAR